MSSREPSVTLRLPARPIAAAQARHAVRDSCRHLPETTVSDATLLVSELVTNAVTHAGGMLTLVIDCEPDRVAIAVADHSTALPVIRNPDSRDPHGRGLRLVDSIAADWGCKPSSDGEGKTVWFSLSA
jgi:anti-sigma regulatory factor (Ser/Thr protein kinase)